MPLTVNGVTVADGDPLLVGGVQAESVTVNGVEVWQNTQAPSAITDFAASDDEYGTITCTWSPATGVPPEITYNLMNADTSALITSDVTSGYVYTVSPTSINLRVDAVNTGGTTPSNSNSGTSLAPPSGSVEYDTVGGHTFTHPAGVTSVTVCMMGGGGAGQYYASGHNDFGGGYSGQEISQAYTLSGTSTPVTVGAGGPAPTGDSSNPGSPSVFGSLSASGGASGSKGTSAGTPYNGNGGSRSTCRGTFTDGTTTNTGTLNYAGGQAGFANGGNAYINQDATRGAGGGAGAGTGSDQAGAGGAGVVHISWG